MLPDKDGPSQGGGGTADPGGSEDPAVSLFREYLRLRTVHPEPDYGAALRFLDRMALELKLPAKKVEVLNWSRDPPASSAVSCAPTRRFVPPSLFLISSFSLRYIEAVRRLRARGTTLPRTVHFLFVPDEEVGGHAGMEMFVKHPEFTKLNIGFALDEGLANPGESYTVFYGERNPWWITVKCPGDPGHGSRFVENTAAEKLRRVINAFLDFRESERKRLNTGECFTLGDVTTVNMTKVNGGVAYNVVPAHMDVSFDMRIPPTVDLQDFEERIKRWCREAGEDVTYQFAQKHMDQEVTSTADSNPWWSAFSTACRTMNMNLKTEIFPAATDSRFFRAVGLPAIGFSPMNNTPILLHDHNEFLNERVFLRGIDVYECLVPALASVAPGPGEA
ncbi:aminoacylase-1-like isoform X2 [Scleropages formosus]|uniref:aminoacylase-1-like isoform X2 n=1 Tax=Scleropages formosus TaxID=113540 RepID=UPI0010FAA5AC|nr:aminoacylase-1 isoform X2 [Scleropages formosus]